MVKRAMSGEHPGALVLIRTALSVHNVLSLVTRLSTRRVSPVWLYILILLRCSAMVMSIRRLTVGRGRRWSPFLCMWLRKWL